MLHGRSQLFSNLCSGSELYSQGLELPDWIWSDSPAACVARSLAAPTCPVFHYQLNHFTLAHLRWALLSAVLTQSRVHLTLGAATSSLAPLPSKQVSHQATHRHHHGSPNKAIHRPRPYDKCHSSQKIMSWVKCNFSSKVSERQCFLPSWLNQIISHRPDTS